MFFLHHLFLTEMFFSFIIFFNENVIFFLSSFIFNENVFFLFNENVLSFFPHKMKILGIYV